MAPFSGWSSTVSRLEPLRGDSLLFTTKFPFILEVKFGEDPEAQILLKVF